MGWTIHTTTMKRSAYEQAFLMIKHIVVINEYDNTHKLFKKEVY